MSVTRHDPNDSSLSVADETDAVWDQTPVDVAPPPPVPEIIAVCFDFLSFLELCVVVFQFVFLFFICVGVLFCLLFVLG